MRGVSSLLFGSLAPLLEVALVATGLLLLGWEGAVYTATGVWRTIHLGSFWTGAPAFLATLPASGACMAAGIALFFLLPPSYAHG